MPPFLRCAGKNRKNFRLKNNGLGSQRVARFARHREYSEDAGNRMKYTRLIIAAAIGYAFTGALSGILVAQAQQVPDAPTWNRPDAVVGLICTWSAYVTYDESIVIDLSDRGAYWVNQNRPLKIHQLNAGRVVLSGVRDQVRISKNRIEKEVALRMVIDRISGAFFVQQQVFRQTAPGRCKRSRLF